METLSSKTYLWILEVPEITDVERGLNSLKVGNNEIYERKREGKREKG